MSEPDRDERLRRLYDERLAKQDAEHPGYAAAWRRLADELLRRGGTHVVPPPQPDPLVDLLRAEGELCVGTAELRLGMPSECHRNAVVLWRAGTAAGIGTGYALSDDGLWREHSWGVAAQDVVIETTELREAYFGIRMAGDRAEWFAGWIEGDPAE